MTFWLDAQLPPNLASWLSDEFSVDASSLKTLGLRDAKDKEIFTAARKAQATVITKDSDFVELVYRHGSPPQILWVTCGNVTNAQLRQVFAAIFQDALRLLANGDNIVEIGDRRE